MNWQIYIGRKLDVGVEQLKALPDIKEHVNVLPDIKTGIDSMNSKFDDFIIEQKAHNKNMEEHNKNMEEHNKNMEEHNKNIDEHNKNMKEQSRHLAQILQQLVDKQ